MVLLASGLVLRFASLERQRDSAFGRYVARTMTRAVEGVRLAGMVVMAVGAWQRSALVIVGGLSIVVLGWTRGLFKPTRDG